MKKMGKKISVIVPVYNVEKYLELCVKSIENQTYKNLEILLIDDGSTDNSLKIALDCSNKYDNIKVISKKNNGQGSARNVGIKESTGDYISFIDSDDIIDKNMYRDMINCITDNKLDIVECSYQEFCKEKKGFVYKSGAKPNELYSGKEYYELNPILSPCNKLYDAHFLKRIGFECTENRYAEDAYDITYLILRADRIMKIDKCYYFYRRDNINSTRNNIDIEHKIKLGIDKLYISSQLNSLKEELGCKGYISNVITRNIFGAIFTKMYFFNKKYRAQINLCWKEHHIKNVLKENINIKILIYLFNVYLRKRIIKKD